MIKMQDAPMAARGEFALRCAAAKAIGEHKRAGNAIVIWQDGHVVEVAAVDIPDEWTQPPTWETVAAEWEQRLQGTAPVEQVVRLAPPKANGQTGESGN